MYKIIFCLFIGFLCTCFQLHSQIDIKNLDVFTIGAGITNTKHQGFYSKTRIRTQNATGTETIDREYPIEKGQHMSLELKLYGSNENTAVYGNFDVAAHLFGLAADVKNSHSERMSNGIFANLFSAPTPQLQSETFPVDVSKDKRFWCHDMIDINMCFGKKSVLFGFDFGWKALGWTFPGTYITNTQNTYTYDFENTHFDLLNRFKVGPSMCFRKNIGKHIALLSFAGVNYMPNVFGSPKYSRRFVNPYINTSIFFGGKYGAVLAINYQYLQAKNESTTVSTLYRGNAVIATTTDRPLMTVSQLEIKLGFYIPGFLVK